MKKVYGWSGKILFIDLANRSTRIEPTERYGSFIGGRGINQWLLFELLEKDVTALDPENPLILGAGPMVGTSVSCASRLAVDYKNVVTGGIGSGSCGGKFALEMKHAGYDHIVIQGRSAEPIYLYIEDDHISFRNASDIWGTDTWETETVIKQKENNSTLSTLAIGVAGENRVAFACIIGDRGRAVGYGGSGAVMGSKNLKAIAIKGTHPPIVANPGELDRKVKHFERSVFEKSRLVKTYREGGTLGAYLLPGENRPHGVKNLNEAFWGNDSLIHVTREKFDEFLIRRDTCSNCSVYCSGIFKVKGLMCEGIQANSLRAFGSNVDVASAEDILYSHALCNTYGLDVDQTSAVVAWAIDCYEQGIIDGQDTDGLELRFGNGSCVASLIKRIAMRDGFGDVLAHGVYGASEIVGRESEKLAAIVKKNGVMEAAMRSHKAWALGIITSTRGTGHLRGAPGMEFQKISPDVSQAILGIDDISDPTAYENKAALVVWQEKYKAVIDMMGICALVTMWMDKSLFVPDDIADMMTDITGEAYSAEDLFTTGERIQTIERSFNLLHAGFGRENDMPPRKFVDSPVNKGVYKDETLDMDQWNVMLDEYYQYHGWDIATGWPTRKCLLNLGLDAVVDKLSKKGINLP